MRGVENTRDKSERIMTRALEAHKSSNFKVAENLYKKLLKRDKNHLDANYLLGTLYAECRNYDLAERHLILASRVAPDSHLVQNNLGNVYSLTDRIDQAVNCYSKAVELNPAFVDAHTNLGSAFNKLGRFDQARASYNKVLKLDPNNAGAQLKSALLSPIISISERQIKTTRRALLKNIKKLKRSALNLNDPFKEVGLTNFYLAYQGFDDTLIQREIADLYLKACPSLVWTAPHCAQERKREKLKIGILSAYLHNHTIGKLYQGLIEKLNREKFEVTIFRYPGQRDKVVERLDRVADRSVQVPLNLREGRESIATQELDILLYPEVGMDPLTYFIAFSRLAPIQVAGWGHPVTTGVPNIDIYLSAKWLEPSDGKSHYSETLVELDNLPTYYYRPDIPEVADFRRQFGLPETGHLYGCPQNLFKLHPSFDDALKKILKSDPDAHLVLIAGKVREWTQHLIERFQKSFRRHVDRVIFLPGLSNTDYLRLLAVCDVLLDPFHFGGGNTSYEALAVGTPLVTLPGDYMRGRVTFACYKTIGYTDLVAKNAADYVRLALKVTHDSAFRNQAVEHIRGSCDRLFENDSAVRDFEEFFSAAGADSGRYGSR